MILKHFSEVFLLVFVFLFFGFCLVFFVGKHYIKPSRIFKILFLGIKSYLKHHCWAIFSIYGQKASFLLPLLHFLFSFILRTSQGFAFPAPPSTGPSLLHGILLSRLSWPAFWPGLSHGWDMVGLELPPHPLGTASLGLCGQSHFLPATRRFDVLISVCCLQLEAKHLPEAHPSELSRRKDILRPSSRRPDPESQLSSHSRSTAVSISQFNLTGCKRKILLSENNQPLE